MSTSPMMIINDTGFAPDLFEARPSLSLSEFLAGDTAAPNTILALDNDHDMDEIETLLPHFASIAVITIPFPSFTDGRGYSLARLLRLQNYQGHLRATGHILSDQYRHMRQSGFDDIAISSDLARRQPESHWQEQITRLKASYQDRLLKIGGTENTSHTQSPAPGSLNIKSPRSPPLGRGQ